MTPNKPIDRPPPDYEEITRRIVEAVSPERVILFGSRARGDHRPDSDIDLLVVFRRVADRGKLIMAMRGSVGYTAVGTDILAYSLQEMRERADWSTSPISSALKEGRVLYERPTRRSRAVVAHRPA